MAIRAGRGLAVRVEALICDECAQTYRLAAGERPDRYTLASVLVGETGAFYAHDDLSLIEAGWKIIDGKHYCPDHYPTAVLEPIPY